MLSAADDYQPAVVQNLAKARTVWRKISIILSREEASPRVSGFFFKAIVQSVLLFGADTWVVTPYVVLVLGGFQYQVARRLTGRLPRRRMDGKWDYTLEEEARSEAGFDPI